MAPIKVSLDEERTIDGLRKALKEARDVVEASPWSQEMKDAMYRELEKPWSFLTFNLETRYETAEDWLPTDDDGNPLPPDPDPTPHD